MTKNIFNICAFKNIDHNDCYEMLTATLLRYIMCVLSRHLSWWYDFQLDCSALATRLFELAKGDTCVSRNRASVYDLVKK